MRETLNATKEKPRHFSARDHLFFRSPRYYYKASALAVRSPAEFPCFEWDSFSRVRSPNKRPLFSSSLFFFFFHAPSLLSTFSSEYMVGRIQIEIFGRLIPEKRRLPLSLRSTSIDLRKFKFPFTSHLQARHCEFRQQCSRKRKRRPWRDLVCTIHSHFQTRFSSAISWWV